MKKEEEERKKKEELLKKQQSKLRLMEKVPPGCVMYRFQSSMVRFALVFFLQLVLTRVYVVQRNFRLRKRDDYDHSTDFWPCSSRLRKERR